MKTPDSNTLDWAKQADGPPRAWFTRNAVVRFVGCYTRQVASSTASTILRGAAVAYGTTEALVAMSDGSAVYFDTVHTFDPQGHRTWAFDPPQEIALTTLRQLGDDPHWDSYDAQQ